MALKPNRHFPIGRNAGTNSVVAVRWLLQKRGSSGGFVSAQDTVITLAALASYAAAVCDSVDLAVGAWSIDRLDETVAVDLFRRSLESL